jgi:beta-glucosidase
MGYLLGRHAPGRRGFRNFLPALHHSVLCQTAGAKIIRSEVSDAQVGTTFNCSVVEPYRNTEKDHIAAKKVDAAFNRLFIEPAIGLGYPVAELPELRKLENYIFPGDDNKLTFEFDFIGIQYYFRLVVAHTWRPPFFMREISAAKRNVKLSTMNYEINSLGFYRAIKRFASYDKMKKIIITEAGVCIPDKLSAKGRIKDKKRIDYYKRLLYYVKKAKQENMPIEGFFAWSLTDNFEWSEGYGPRFGLIYIDYSTQKRIIKDSGKWFKEFLK